MMLYFAFDDLHYVPDFDFDFLATSQQIGCEQCLRYEPFIMLSGTWNLISASFVLLRRLCRYRAVVVCLCGSVGTVFIGRFSVLSWSRSRSQACPFSSRWPASIPTSSPTSRPSSTSSTPLWVSSLILIDCSIPAGWH